jgi:hypothetical protein
MLVKHAEKFLYFSIGFFLCSLLAGYIANAQTITVSDLQDQYYKQHRVYFSDHSDKDYTINTYEQVCKGYYTVERTYDKLIYTGYGDLADEYTYTEDVSPRTISSTSTLQR